MGKTMFRDEALKRLASPDRLDESISITKPGNWISLATITFLIVAIVCWSFLGNITSYVNGDGILINEAGVSEVKTSFSGRLNGLLAEVGDTIQQGQIIATVEQLDKGFEIKRLEIQHREIQKKYTWLLENKAIETRRKAIGERKAFHSKTTMSIDAIENALLTDTLLYDSLVNEKEELEKEVTIIHEELMELENYSEARLLEMKSRLLELQSEIIYKKNILKLQSEIYCPYSGVVTEVMLNNGDVFSNSTSILTLENADYNKDELIALIYVNAHQGNRVKVGMQVYVSPSTIKAEEYGYLEGEVTYVSRYPSTYQGMNRVLRNEKTVEALSVDGLPLAIEVKLKVDSNAFSGYRWTSSQGPRTAVVSGILANARILIESKAPITLVIPSLAESLE
jgi:HlyD family secretion protein